MALFNINFYDYNVEKTMFVLKNQFSVEKSVQELQRSNNDCTLDLYNFTHFGWYLYKID